MTALTRSSACVIAVLVIAAASAGNPSSQSAGGTISGRVTDPDGSPFTIAFVQATDAQGKTFNGNASPDGRYTLQVPAGTYEVSVNLPTMKSFRRANVVVTSGQNTVIDVRLEDGPSLRTLGEDPASIIATFFNRPAPPKGPTPRMANRRPDLSGVWLGPPAALDTLELQPWAAALAKERTDNNSKDFPPTYCLPNGPIPLLDPGFFEIVQNSRSLIMLFEGDTPGYRYVFLDGRARPKNFESSWLGHSVGRWEKDTLVVESIGFRDRGWLDFEGQPHSDKLRVTHRFSRPDLGRLNIEITIDDPGALQKPWKTTKVATLAPDEETREYICNENNKAPIHVVGK